MFPFLTAFDHRHNENPTGTGAWHMDAGSRWR
jgi:hypothetical protein